MRAFLLLDGVNLVGLRVISLNSLDGVQEIWFDSQGIEGILGNNTEVHLAELRGRGSESTRWNNMKVQLSKLFDKHGQSYVNLEVVAVRLAAQGISHYISLAWRIGIPKSKSATSSIHLC